MSKLTRNLIIALISGVIIIVTPLLIVFTPQLSVNVNDWSALGSYVGGLLSPYIAALALLGLISTIKQQAKEVSILEKHNQCNQLELIIHKIESDFKDVDHLYIALGTTRKKAGSAYNFKKVDYHYCINLARIANDCGVKSISIISSVGSDPNSSFLYPMTKGLIEKDISKISLHHLSIVRPGIILGKRNESRIGEKIGKVIFSLIDKLLFGKLSKYKSISADNISKAMIYQVVNSSPGVNILEYKELINSSNSFDDLIKLD